jgi:cytochrome c oxidase subunit 4
MTFGPETNPRRAATAPFVWLWFLLLVLFALSFAVAFLGLGVWTPIVQFGIAAIQTSLLFVFFMRLKGPPSLKWIFAVTGFVWLLFLYGLSMTDYSNRSGWPPGDNTGAPTYGGASGKPLKRSR